MQQPLFSYVKPNNYSDIIDFDYLPCLNVVLIRAPIHLCLFLDTMPMPFVRLSCMAHVEFFLSDIQSSINAFVMLVRKTFNALSINLLLV